MTSLPPSSHVPSLLDGPTEILPFIDSYREVADQQHVAKTQARVLHVINGEHYSGAERVQDLLALNLPKMGYHVDFACVKPGRFLEARIATEAEAIALPMRHRLDLMQAERLAHLVRKGDYQLIHAHTPRTAMLGMIASLRTGRPLVYHVHSPTSRDSTRKVRNWVNQKIEMLAIRKAARLICVSESLADHVRGLGVPNRKIHVVHNGVPCVENPPNRTPPTTEWTLGTVALFRPRKGLEILLEAMAKLRDAGHEIRLRAVGPFETPEYERHIKQLVEKHRLASRIDWVGFTQDVPSELRKMDLFVLPSLFGEGLPMVVLEAMAAGTPVAATAVEGVTEAIDDNHSGIIAHPNDASHLATRIRDLVEGRLDWSTLRENALERHRRYFSDEAMAMGVAEVYRGM